MTRITARIRRRDDGQLHHEYIVRGVGYGSIEAIEAVLANR